MGIRDFLMISEYALMRFLSIAFGGILHTDVAPCTAQVHVIIKEIREVTVITAWLRFSPRILREYLEHQC